MLTLINLNHEINFILKNNGLLTQLTIKNKISQLLPKYKHGNSTHEHIKQ